MVVINKIKMDLQQKQNIQYVDVVQGDTNSRILELYLYSGGVPWDVPSGVLAAVSYLREDGVKGIYDTLPDGNSAVHISENMVSIVIIPQAISLPGEAKINVVLSYSGSGGQLASFPVCLKVEPNSAVDALSPDDYINLKQWVDEAINEIVIPDTLPNPQKLILTGAVAAEYDGSAEVTVKIPEGGSGGSAEIHIGSDEPTGDEVVWIDPDAEADSDPDAEADSGFIQAPATAEVGQTIVVKAVDENGKPTKWECVDIDKKFTEDPQLDIIVEKDVTTLLYDTLNGVSLADYGYTAMYVWVGNTPQDTATSVEFLTHVNYPATNALANGVTFSAGTGFIKQTAQKYWSCFADLSNKVFMQLSQPTTKVTLRDTVSSPATYYSKLFEANTIYNFAFHSLKSIPAGTQIKVWLR